MERSIGANCNKCLYLIQYTNVKIKNTNKYFYKNVIQNTNTRFFEFSCKFCN